MKTRPRKTTVFCPVALIIGLIEINRRNAAQFQEDLLSLWGHDPYHRWAGSRRMRELDAPALFVGKQYANIPKRTPGLPRLRCQMYGPAVRCKMEF